MKLLSVAERHDAQQVGREFAHVAVAPSAVVHVVLSVVVAEDELVYGLRAVYYLVDERLAECVFVRTFWLVRGCHADASHLAFMYVVGCKEQVVLVVGM